MKLFGDQLRVWLDFLMLRQEDFAVKCDLHVSYVRNVLQGAKPNGIRMPGRKNRDAILAAIAKEWGHPVSVARFWEGPPPTRETPATEPQLVDLERVLASNELTYHGRPLSATERDAVRNTMRSVLALLHPER